MPQSPLESLAVRDLKFQARALANAIASVLNSMPAKDTPLYNRILAEGGNFGDITEAVEFLIRVSLAAEKIGWER